MFRATRPAQLAMVSTRAGMRRILKRPEPYERYLKLAVETGVYRTQEEIEQVRRERASGKDDLRVIMKRFRQDIVRGSNIQDYPIEYQILRQHPPLPERPRIPVKIRKKMRAAPNPTEALVKKYLRRQDSEPLSMEDSLDNSIDEDNDASSSRTMSSDEYYRRLLGDSAAAHRESLYSSKTTPASVTMKSASIQKAYAAAIHHYQLQRTHADWSDDQVMAQVDALLQEQNNRERERSSKYRQQATKTNVRKQQQQQQPQTVRQKEQSYSKFLWYNDNDESGALSGSSDGTAASAQDDTPPLFQGHPRALEAMMRWSERLQAVPYEHWTVGASTALDHWIARQVLGLSEETWQCLLEGLDDATLLSRGRDIVATREMLFPETAGLLPETIQQQEQVEEELQADMESFEEAEDEDDADLGTVGNKEKTIDELLASLGGLNTPNTSKKDFDKWSFADTSSMAYEDWSSIDGKVDRLVEELQDWRRKNLEHPYETWNDADRQKFNAWLHRYVSVVLASSSSDRGSSSSSSTMSVDYDMTRQALLADPPVTRDESNSFWNALENESLAADLLDHMIQDGPPPGASLLQQSFWQLPYTEQLERLCNLGALRPLLDEYIAESDRLRFVQRYGDVLMAGVELEYLIADPKGPVSVGDLDEGLAAAVASSDVTQFRLERKPYPGTALQGPGDEDKQHERTKALYAAWNEHKAGRARYEEALFKSGRLGLRYDRTKQQIKRGVAAGGTGKTDKTSSIDSKSPQTRRPK